jgi:hypothetical protein
MSIAVLLEAAEFLERRERGTRCWTYLHLSSLRLRGVEGAKSPSSESHSGPKSLWMPSWRKSEREENKTNMALFSSVHKTFSYTSAVLRKCLNALRRSRIAQSLSKYVLISLITSHGGPKLEFIILSHPPKHCDETNFRHVIGAAA